ncbi:CHAT domain-containing protein [Pyxidicoccus parkwayensis]|uniref:CHAT domain-containing protein n=1 Tax=Pyxidicoccus parkwayensis TaxID=2813578 RepID=A0ABX7NZ04_9BACT|nr:CHAT domain-containing protein [Pyxidicoccus parkwaysis]QSQ24167.1 CHAT domain-containing protein [Pyxidicoccus parkwaysis]
MSELCERLERFVDGELPPVEAENFRHHLTRCGACEARMKELLAMELLADDVVNTDDEAPGPGRAVTPLASPWRRRAWLMAVPLALAAGVATLVVLSRADSQPDADALWLARAPTRLMEARLTLPGADRHKPYEVMRSQGTVAQPLPMHAMAQLEKAGDDRGLATAFLLRGELGQATAYLGKLPASPDLDSDRAVVAMQRQDWHEALQLQERALKARPQHPQALWNRGLALRALGLPLQAAESFEQVAALKEPGWSDEAAQKARELRGAAEAERKDWKGAREDCQRMVEGGEPLTLQQAEALPGMARVCLYNAMRTATSPERLEALRPLAAKLDEKQGGSHLEDSLRRAARQDFAVRAPLARDYIRLTKSELKGAEAEAFISRLREARQEDILLGALAYGDPREHPDEYRALALATKDPWFTLLAEEQQAKAEALRDDLYGAQERLEAAVQSCRNDARQGYRCMTMMRELGLVSVRLNRPVEANAHFLEAMALARASQEWGTQRVLLPDLGQVARTRNDLVMARAYLEELVAQTPESCAGLEVTLTNLALAHHRALDFTGARQQLDRASRCGRKPSMARISLLADLARTDQHQPGDTQQFVDALAVLREADSQEPGDLALLRHVEGRYFLEQDRARGQQLLRQALDEAAKLPASDVSARKARVYSYTSLILDAGRNGELEQGLALFAEEHGISVPARCVLGVTVDDERTFVVARDDAGRITGHYDAGRKVPLDGVEGLVPPDVVEALRACPSVDVLARPPVQGRAGLLPPELAWSYRVGPAAAPQAPQVRERRLVVTDVRAPASLRLPALRPWSTTTPEDPNVTVLRGAAATPVRVLEAMRDATEVQVHAHGIIDPGVADASVLVLSPMSDTGRFALTTGDLREQRLRGHPVVVLAACYAAHTSAYTYENFGLPLAFIESGARAVLAATEEIPDAEAAAFFDPVLARIRAGTHAAVALRDERQSWLQHHGSTWVRQVLLFE